MALDHVRDFFDADAMRFSPTDLSHTYTALFLTRFITHYCAPGFALLAGLSACLRGSRPEGRAGLGVFLLTRGLWLVLLDVVVISPIWTLEFGRIELGTLWAIGCGMIALSALVHWPAGVALAIGALILSTHDLLGRRPCKRVRRSRPVVEPAARTRPAAAGARRRGPLPRALPWIGVVASAWPRAAVSRRRLERKRILTSLGLGALALFAILRGGDFYGDPRPWSVQSTPTLTALSFLNVSKYPPSLLYALVTLGPALVLLPRLERLGGAVGEVLGVFGRTPLFFYVLHLYVGLAAAIALELARGFRPSDIAAFAAGKAPPENFGVGLFGAYIAWIAIVAALYPACKWFAGVKRRRRDWWLGYL